ncbi:MAG: hypothetical protein ACTMHL_02500 [Janibacter sp.]
MTRNRDRPAAEPQDRASWGYPVGVVLTLVLLAPGSALLAARAHGLLDIQTTGGTRTCSGTDILGPVLHAGLPVVALLIAVPVAVLSLGHRARGWVWLVAALGGTVLLDLALRLWLPACL